MIFGTRLLVQLHFVFTWKRPSQGNPYTCNLKCTRVRVNYYREIKERVVTKGNLLEKGRVGNSSHRNDFSRRTDV